MATKTQAKKNPAGRGAGKTKAKGGPSLGPLGQRLGPLPIWGWAAVVVVGVLVFRQTRRPPRAEEGGGEAPAGPFLQGAYPPPARAPFGAEQPEQPSPTPTPAPEPPARRPITLPAPAPGRPGRKPARTGTGIPTPTRPRRGTAPPPAPAANRPGRMPPVPIVRGAGTRLAPTGRTPAKRSVAPRLPAVHAGTQRVVAD